MTGAGTAGDPYVIWDADDLQDIDLDRDAFYILGSDIDASATIGWNGGDGFDPIGTSWNVNPFTGHFDGKGYTISELHIDRNATDYVGLFAATRDNGGAGLGILQNVILASVDITGDDIVGALCGDVYGATPTITNCHSSGTVAGSATGDAIGGLIGLSHAPLVECTTSCTVDGQAYLGGLVGQFSGSSMVRCLASGDVTGTLDNIGGLIGQTLDDGGPITQCLATGDVTGDDYVGGLIGDNSSLGSNVTDCYARGAVTGDDRIGGLLGGTSLVIDNCYSTGVVIGNTNVGGFCGQIQGAGTISAECFWDTETSGQGASDGGTGKTTAELKNIATIQAAGWAISTIWNVTLGCNNGYPCLIGVNPCCVIGGTPEAGDKVTLEAIRNIEIVYGGRFLIDKEGNAKYESRYHRNV